MNKFSSLYLFQTLEIKLHSMSLMQVLENLSLLKHLNPHQIWDPCFRTIFSLNAQSSDTWVVYKFFFVL